MIRLPQGPLASFQTTATMAVGFVPDDRRNGRWLRSGRRPSGRLASFRTTANRAVGFVPDDDPKGRWLRSGQRSQGRLASFRRMTTRAVGFVPEDDHKGGWLRSGRPPQGPLASFRTTATRAVGFVPDHGHNGRWLRSGPRPQRRLASFRRTANRAVGFVPEDGQPASRTNTSEPPRRPVLILSRVGRPSIGRRRRGIRPGSACIPASGRSRKLVGPVPIGRSPSRFPEIDIEAGRRGPAPRNLPQWQLASFRTTAADVADDARGGRELRSAMHRDFGMSRRSRWNFRWFPNPHLESGLGEFLCIRVIRERRGA